MNAEELIKELRLKWENEPIKAYYGHFPKLQIPLESYSILGGCLRYISFAEFMELDRDWANESYFYRTEPVFWHYDLELQGRVCNSEEEIHRETKSKTMLIHNALILLMVSDQFPNPIYSMRYIIKTGGVSRCNNLFHRNYILNGEKAPVLTYDQLTFIRNSVEDWHNQGYSYDDDIFLLIHAISSVSSGNLPSYSAILPLVVALEGYFIDGEVKGIAKEICKRINSLFQKTGINSNVDLERIVKQSYSWRSIIIHGRNVDSLRFTNPDQDLKNLLVDITIAALKRVNQLGLSTQELSSFQQKLYED